jgi:hypothetical protein
MGGVRALITNRSREVSWCAQNGTGRGHSFFSTAQVQFGSGESIADNALTGSGSVASRRRTIGALYIVAGEGPCYSGDIENLLEHISQPC